MRAPTRAWEGVGETRGGEVASPTSGPRTRKPPDAAGARPGRNSTAVEPGTASGAALPLKQVAEKLLGNKAEAGLQSLGLVSQQGRWQGVQGQSLHV